MYFLIYVCLCANLFENFIQLLLLSHCLDSFVKRVNAAIVVFEKLKIRAVHVFNKIFDVFSNLNCKINIDRMVFSSKIL